MLRSILAASVIAAAAVAVGAHAQDEQTASVSTRGVDFNNPSDVKALYSRIRTAADVVCTRQGPADMAARKYEQACMADAVRNAVDSIDQPPLTEVARGETGANVRQMAVRERRDDEGRSTR